MHFIPNTWNLETRKSGSDGWVVLTQGGGGIYQPCSQCITLPLRYTEFLADLNQNHQRFQECWTILFSPAPLHRSWLATDRNLGAGRDSVSCSGTLQSFSLQCNKSDSLDNRDDFPSPHFSQMNELVFCESDNQTEVRFGALFRLV